MWSGYVSALLLLSMTTLLIWLWKAKKVTSKADVGRPKVTELGYLQSLALLLKLVRNTCVPLCELVLDFSKRFGSVLILKNPISGQVYCVLTDMPLAKSIMSSSGWMNRLPSKHYVLDYSWGKPLGIIFGNDGYWKEGRKLTLKLLHKLDFFRMENMENFISFEAVQIEKEFSGAIQASGGEEAVMTVHRMFEIYTLNVVLQVIMGKRFERGDPTIKSLLSALHAANRDFNLGTGILDFFPWLRHLPGLQFNQTTQHCLKDLHGYFQKELLEPKRKSGTYKTSPVDFSDHFLLEIDRRSGANPCYLTDENFLSCMRDLVIGGSDTTSSVLEHVILHVSLQPAIQTKVQDEIDQVIGARGPTYEDRLRMPYTLALIWETLRYAAPVPVATRVPLADSQISSGEVVVPKDTLVAINIHAIHHSDEIWSNPGEFRPERFLNGNSQELVNVDKIMPFGYGKRVCIGEAVGKITLFIVVSSLLQKFTFELSNSHAPPTMKNQMGLSRSPFPYYIKVRPRAVPAGAAARE